MQSAQRINNLEKPFVDFDEPYTGGLAYLHAWIFESFGEKLVYLRYVLLLAVIFSVWPVYSIVNIYYNACQSFFITCFIFLTSFPSFFSPMPTWHMTILSFWCLYFLILYFKKVNSVFLIMSGLSIGLAILLKINSLILLLAACYVLLYKKIIDLESQPVKSDTKLAALQYSVIFLISLPISYYLYQLCSKILIKYNLSSIIFYLLPSGLISVLIIWNLILRASKINIAVLSDLIKEFLLLIAPITLIILIYFFSIYDYSELKFVIQGLFSNPGKRFQAVSELPKPILYYLASAAVIISIMRLYIMSSGNALHRKFFFALSILLMLFCLYYRHSFFLLLLGVSILFIPVFSLKIYYPANDLVLIASGIFYSFYSLVQFPYFNVVYFLYSVAFLYLFIFILYKHNLCLLIKKYGPYPFIFFICLAVYCNTFTERFYNIFTLYSAVQNKLLREDKVMNSGLMIEDVSMDFLEEVDDYLQSDFKNKKLLIVENMPLYSALKFKNQSRFFYESLSSFTPEQICSYYKQIDFDIIMEEREDRYMQRCSFDSDKVKYHLVKSTQMFDFYERRVVSNDNN